MTSRNLSILLAMGTLTFSCGTYRAPEKIADKMERFQSSNFNPNPIPHIELWELPTARVKSKRAPASVVTEGKKKKVSHKQMYFKTLYHQYNHLQAYLEVKDQKKLNHCPGFHNTFLNERLKSNISNKTISHNKVSNLKHNSPLSTLKDSMKKESTYSALQAYVTNTYNELEEFCDTGTSANYYNFSNLITHVHKNSRDFASDQTKSMKSLLKTSVYANIAIIKSLKSIEQSGRFPASQSQALSSSEKDLHQYVQTDWSEQLFR